jgi:hypothetical protein
MPGIEVPTIRVAEAERSFEPSPGNMVNPDSK